MLIPVQTMVPLGKNNLDDVILEGLIKERIANLDKFRLFSFMPGTSAYERSRPEEAQVGGELVHREG